MPTARPDSYSIGSGGALFAGVAPPPAIPSYVPTTVGEAKLITLTNTLLSVYPSLPPGVAGDPIFLGDYSGGATNPWAGAYGKHLVHGGGHAACDDSGVYAVNYGETSASWELVIGTPDLRTSGTWYNYGGGDYGNSYGYYIARGTGSTDPANPTNAGGWGEADDPTTNPREVLPGIPGSAHTYDTLHVIPPTFAGDAQGALLRNGSFAVGRVPSRDTFFAHKLSMTSPAWARFAQRSIPLSRTSSIDTLRGRAKFPSGRGYRDLTTGAWVEVAGSVSLQTGYVDNVLSGYHAARDIHVFVTNTEAETQAAEPSKWNWWPGGDDPGTRNIPTWVGGVAPPGMARAQPLRTGEAGLAYVDALGQFCYYTRADQDAYYLIDVPSTPSNPWTWTRVAMTGTGRPSLLGLNIHQNVYGRWGWLPALKCISFIPLNSQTVMPNNVAILIRLVP